MAQSVACICGFETGDASELTTLGAGASIQGSTLRTGAYALKNAPTASRLSAALAATQWVIRFYFRVPALSAATINIAQEVATGSVARLRLRFNASNKLVLADAGVTLGLAATAGTTTLNVDQWYRMEIFLDLAAGGVVKLLVDGGVEINTTHTNDVSATTAATFDFFGNTTPNEYFFDDIRVDKDGVAAIGAGQCIARQGVTGTPTYDAWTKSGAATADLCWSDTPFATATKCTSSTSGDAQTMGIALFSQRQAGHGLEVIGSVDTVNACKTALIGKAAAGSSPSIRRRVNGANTDTAVTFTTADAYYDDGIWTTTPGNLDSLEAGIVHAADTNLETIEDVWVMVDYTPAIADILRPQALM